MSVVSRFASFLFTWTALGIGTSLPSTAQAAEPSSSNEVSLAITIGVNRPVDAELQPLRYADDDAARTYDLMRASAVPAWIVTRLDENTARLHPKANEAARAPTLAALRAVIADVRAAVEHAHASGKKVSVFVFYAGHGAVRNGEGYITLEDARVTGPDLVRELTTPIGADRYHFVLDACAAHAVAFGRGPGGSARSSEGLKELSRLKDDPRVGLLLSTTAAAETHEWDALQAGIFSHEVRSGLLGAADGDGDGVVSYREMVSFIRQANAAVPNERYRPNVVARAPAAGEALFDLRSAPGGRVVIDKASAGRYVIEDSLGVRIADLHSLPQQRVSLLRAGGYFLRAPDGSREHVVSAGAETIELATLEESVATARSRGAAHESFSRLFAAPFDPADVAKTSLVVDETFVTPRVSDSAPSTNTRRYVGYGIIGASALAMAAGTYAVLKAGSLERGGAADDSQLAVSERNASIRSANTAGLVSFIAAGALGVTGVTLVVLPSAAPRESGVARIDGWSFGTGGTF